MVLLQGRRGLPTSEALASVDVAAEAISNRADARERVESTSCRQCEDFSQQHPSIKIHKVFNQSRKQQRVEKRTVVVVAVLRSKRLGRKLRRRRRVRDRSKPLAASRSLYRGLLAALRRTVLTLRTLCRATQVRKRRRGLRAEGGNRGTEGICKGCEHGRGADYSGRGRDGS